MFIVAKETSFLCRITKLCSCFLFEEALLAGARKFKLALMNKEAEDLDDENPCKRPGFVIGASKLFKVMASTASETQRDGL